VCSTPCVTPARTATALAKEKHSRNHLEKPKPPKSLLKTFGYLTPMNSSGRREARLDPEKGFPGERGKALKNKIPGNSK
jgi:hypothetical protein